MVESPNPILRAATKEDANAIAGIWWLGWNDGHRGFVPQELVEARTEASFWARAAKRSDEITVAVVDDAVAGFILVADDEVEQVYVAAAHRGAGVAGLRGPITVPCRRYAKRVG